MREFIKRFSLEGSFDFVVYLLLFFLPLFFIPGVNNVFELPKMALFRSGVLLMLLFYVLGLLRSREMGLPDVFGRLWVRRLLIGALLMLFLGVVVSVAPKMSFWGSYYRLMGAYSLFHFLLFFLLLSLGLRSIEQWRKGFVALFAGFLLVVFYGFLQWIGWDFFAFDLEEMSLGRIFSSFGHPNYLANYLLLVIFPLMFFADEKRWLWGAVAAGVFMLFLTGSRAALLGFGAGLLVFLWKGKGQRWMLVFLLLLGILGLFFGRIGEMRSVFSRLEVWEVALQMLNFWGYGFESFSLVFPQFSGPELLELETLNSLPDKLHNSFLEIGMSLGIVGVAYFLTFLAVTGRTLWKGRGLEVAALAASFTALFVANMFGFSSTGDLMVFTFLLAYLMFVLSKERIVRTLPDLGSKVLRSVLVFVIVIFSLGSIGLQNALYLIADYNFSQGKVLEAASLYPEQRYYNYYLALLTEDERYADFGGNFAGFHDHYYYFLKGRLSGEEEYFKKAYELAPYYPPNLLYWGESLVEDGGCERALEKFDEYLEIVPNDWADEGSEKQRLFYKHNPNFDRVFELRGQCNVETEF